MPYERFSIPILPRRAEGFRKTVIRRPVEITEAKSVSGDYDIIKPHTEDAIEVSVVVHQTYRIADDRVEKVVDDIRMRFILSNGGIDSGKYLILFIYRPTEDDIVYEDIVRSEVRQSSNGDLRGALTAAGMDGLGP